jgi:predicted DNA-binding protein with PD1-like motif
MGEVRAKHVSGGIGKVVPVRLLPGTDVIEGFLKTCADHDIRSGTILSAIGSLRHLTIKVLVPNKEVKLGAAYGDPVTSPGPIEILSLGGVIFEDEATGEVDIHMHGTFCDQDGKTLGGHVIPEENPVLATVDAVLAEVSGARFMRRHDEETGLLLFSPEVPS